MKRILLILASLVLLLGCVTPFSYFDERYSDLASGHDLYYSDAFNDIETSVDVSNWIRDNVSYVADVIETWNDPETTVLIGFGDCDDYAILVMNILYVRFGVETDLVLIYDKQVVGGGRVNHATVSRNGIVYNVYNLEYYYTDPKIGYKYTFWEVFDKESIR